MATSTSKSSGKGVHKAEKHAVVAGLSTIPAELLARILQYLAYPDLLALNQTCKAYRASITPAEFDKAFQTYRRFLLYLENEEWSRRQTQYIRSLSYTNAAITRFPYSETYPLDDDVDLKWLKTYRPAPDSTYIRLRCTYLCSDSDSNIHVNGLQRPSQLTCHYCLWSLPVGAFATSQRTGRRSLGHVDARKRFCVKCGVQKRMWSLGVVIKGVSFWYGPYKHRTKNRTKETGRPRHDLSYIFCVKCHGAEVVSPASHKLGSCVYCFHGIGKQSGEMVDISDRGFTRAREPFRAFMQRLWLEEEPGSHDAENLISTADGQTKKNDWSDGLYPSNDFSKPIPLARPFLISQVAKSSPGQSTSKTTDRPRSTTPAATPAATSEPLRETDPNSTAPSTASRHHQAKPTNPPIPCSEAELQSTSTSPTLPSRAPPPPPAPSDTDPPVPQDKNEPLPKRNQRCQRCWALDHTFRPTLEVIHGQGYCVTCLRAVVNQTIKDRDAVGKIYRWGEF